MRVKRKRAQRRDRKIEKPAAPDGRSPVMHGRDAIGTPTATFLFTSHLPWSHYGNVPRALPAPTNFTPIQTTTMNFRAVAFLRTPCSLFHSPPSPAHFSVDCAESAHTTYPPPTLIAPVPTMEADVPGTVSPRPLGASGETLGHAGRVHPPNTGKRTGHRHAEKGTRKRKKRGKFIGKRRLTARGAQKARRQALFLASHQVRRVSFDNLSTPLFLFSGSRPTAAALFFVSSHAARRTLRSTHSTRTHSARRCDRPINRVWSHHGQQQQHLQQWWRWWIL